jgi:hypothetical protein
MILVVICQTVYLIDESQAKAKLLQQRYSSLIFICMESFTRLSFRWGRDNKKDLICVVRVDERPVAGRLWTPAATRRLSRADSRARDQCTRCGRDNCTELPTLKLQ